MKTFHASSYKFIGGDGDWFVFESLRQDLDIERVYVKRAKLINLDGTSTYYDNLTVPKQQNVAQRERLRAYAERIGKATRVNPHKHH